MASVDIQFQLKINKFVDVIRSLTTEKQLALRARQELLSAVKSKVMDLKPGYPMEVRLYGVPGRDWPRAIQVLREEGFTVEHDTDGRESLLVSWGES